MLVFKKTKPLEAASWTFFCQSTELNNHVKYIITLPFVSII